MTDELHPGLLKKPEIAKALRCSERTIDKWRKKEGLPYYQFGNVIRFDRADVFAWLRERMTNKVTRCCKEFEASMEARSPK